MKEVKFGWYVRRPGAVLLRIHHFLAELVNFALAKLEIDREKEVRVEVEVNHLSWPSHHKWWS